MLIDSTTAKAHKVAAGQKNTLAIKALGRSRGGFATKMQAVVDALGTCLHLILTPGEAANSPQLPGLLAALPERPGAVLADKAYDTNTVVDTLAYHEAEAITTHSRPIEPARNYNKNFYADRNKVERFFGRLEEACGFAIRYEKTATF